MTERIRTRSGSSNEEPYILVEEEQDWEDVESSHYLLQEGVRLLDRLVKHLSASNTSGRKMVTIRAAAMEWLNNALEEEKAPSTSTISKTPTTTSYMNHLIKIRHKLLFELRPLLPAVSHLQILGGSAWPEKRQQRQHFIKIHVDLFPNIQGLLLDQVIPEWIFGLENIASQLTILNMQRGCIYDMYSLFHSASFNFFPNLTHVRLSNCAIGELSGLQLDTHSLPQSTSTTASSAGTPPIFSQLPHLKSINLSHNQIIRVETAAAGFKSLFQIEKIDLSHNYIGSFRNANLYLGNIHSLYLSHNRLRTVAGLDRLYSLQTLFLDHNCINSMAEFAKLAYNLPHLSTFTVRGNPLFQTTTIDNKNSISITIDDNYRMSIWNLFWEARCDTIQTNSTTTPVSIFPTLDGKVITSKEWALLKKKCLFLERMSTTTTKTMSIATTYSTTNNYREIKTSYCSNTATTTSSNTSNTSSITCSEETLQTPKQLFKRVTRSARTRLASIQNDALSDEPDARSIHRFSNGSTRLSTNEHQFQILHNVILSAFNNKYNFTKNEQELSTYKDLDEQQTIILESKNDKNNPNKQISSFLLSVFEHVAMKENYYDYSTCNDDSHFSVSPNTVCSTDFLLLQASSSSSLFDINTIFPLCKEDEATKKDVQNSVSCDKDIANEQHTEIQVTSTQPTAPKSPQRESTTDKKNKKKKDADKVSYDGLEDLSKVEVNSNNLELYFQQFVFRDEQPRIRLRESDHPKNISSSQSFVALYNNLSVIPCGKASISRLGVVLKSRLGFHGDVHASSVVSCEKTHVLLLSDVALYFIPIPDPKQQQQTFSSSPKRKFPSPIPQGARFQDGWLPHSAATHGLAHLKRMTIGFGFQRLTLHFIIPNSSNKQKVGLTGKTEKSSSVTVFCYVIFTCNKSKCVELLQQLQSRAKEAIAKERLFLKLSAQDEMSEDGPYIDNDDKWILDSLHSIHSNTDNSLVQIGTVLHYQLVQQHWKSRGADYERGSVRRVCVVTDANILLLDEDYFGDGCDAHLVSSKEILGSVKLQLIDFASLSQIVEICAANQDPCAITLVIRKASNKLLSAVKPDHKWRLTCKDGEGAEALIDEVRRAKTQHRFL